jgi:hypothetical protein
MVLHGFYLDGAAQAHTSRIVCGRRRKAPGALLTPKSVSLVTDPTLPDVDVVSPVPSWQEMLAVLRLAGGVSGVFVSREGYCVQVTSPVPGGPLAASVIFPG